MNAGRPLGFDPDEMLATCLDVFWTRGYGAASVEDVVQATGLSRSSLYQTFGSKQQLFERCIDVYCERLALSLGEVLSGAPNGLEYIRRVLLEAALEARNDGSRKGCLLMNTATECAQRDPVIAAAVARGTETILAVMTAAARRGQSDGSLRADASPRVLGRYFMTVAAGLRTLIKGGAGPREVHNLVDVALKSFAGPDASIPRT